VLLAGAPSRRKDTLKCKDDAQALRSKVSVPEIRLDLNQNPALVSLAPKHKFHIAKGGRFGSNLQHPSKNTESVFLCHHTLKNSFSLYDQQVPNAYVSC
jgi:hypothetical protein